ncbi:MAG: hypothetical protein JEZ02_00900 [Desulfatibacillum sp.]|nr:hypothetical protein [Desulfatibacillum sp.]
MAFANPQYARQSPNSGRAETPWWKLAVSCGLLLLVVGCYSFIFTTQYFQLSVFVADAWTLPFLAHGAFLGLAGLGAALGGTLAQTRKTPMLYLARLALAGGVFAALCPQWMGLAKYLYPAIGRLVHNLPCGTGMAEMLLAGLALLPTALLWGASIPAAAALTGENRQAKGFFHASWLAGAALGPVGACVISVFITEHGLWAPLLALLMTAIGANNLARISPAVILQNQPYHLPIKQSLPIMASGMVWAVLALCLIRLLGPVLGMGFFTPLAVSFCILLSLALGCAFFSLRGRPGLPGISACLGLMGFWLALAWAVGDKFVILSDGLEPIKSQGVNFLFATQGFVAALMVLPLGMAGGFLFCTLHPAKTSPCRASQEGAIIARIAWGAALGVALFAGLVICGTATAKVFWGTGLALVLSSISLSLVRLKTQRGVIIPATLIILGLASFQMLRYPGPTAVWTQHDINQGRTHMAGKDFNSMLDWLRSVRRPIIVEINGPVGATAIRAHNSLALVENGVTRSNVRLDAARDVMLGLTPAALHPKPGNALVLGLGSGNTAGWLARVESVRQVEVVEENLQSLDMARFCASANFQVMENPKIRVRLGSFRPTLVFTQNKYDLLIQGPGAQPFIATPGLFTTEYFALAANCLAPQGLYCLALSIRSMDAITVQSLYGSLNEVFPHIQTFWPDPETLFLVCSQDAIQFRENALRKCLASEPYATAMTKTWGVSGLEGFFSRYLAGPGFARNQASLAIWNDILNTDISPKANALYTVSQGRNRPSSFLTIQDKNERERTHQPFFTQGNVNIRRSREWQVEMYVLENYQTIASSLFSPDMEPLVQACRSFQQRNYFMFLGQWENLGLEPQSPLEQAMVSYALAMEGNPRAIDLAPGLAQSWPQVSQVCQARYYWNTGERTRALSSLQEAFESLHNDSWPWLIAMEWGLDLAREMAETDKNFARRVADMVSSPFHLMALEEKRLETFLAASLILGDRETVAAMEQFGPHFPWTRDFLNQRLRAYKSTQDPRAAKALADMQTYLSSTLLDFSDALVYD